MLRKIGIMLEMIKFEHTVFALPFAFMGAFLAGRGAPSPEVFLWVLAAMVGARTSAMGFNRIADRHFDRKNPRTADRAIPAGAVKLWEAWLMVVIAAAIFFFACYNLNRLTLILSPFALGLTFFYSLTKRFTWLCHVVLGIALAFSPLGGWVAVTGSLAGFPYVLSAGVLLWVAGFDTVYACLDADFDREAGLFSLPARFGREGAFRLAVFFHLLAFVLFVLTGVQQKLGMYFYAGIIVTAIALFYQHLIVNPKDLSRIKMSFFTLNGLISLTIFVATWLDISLN
ncbi:MAG: putative 4-hydroxybenzoate polyprenyltransferase [Proteobacteria bacterium]|nr:putative 4-hydroxybenzoate polyprenyltransferase [Pseudomonadota bacterium]MBU1737163.1 putative 4-hydroxybenzoate polyprenyltransferase [Pseudomonadota bacterium]